MVPDWVRVAVERQEGNIGHHDEEGVLGSATAARRCCRFERKPQPVVPD